jgi:hypothetical protein
MTEAYVLTIGQNAIVMALILAGPILVDQSADRQSGQPCTGRNADQ